MIDSKLQEVHADLRAVIEETAATKLPFQWRIGEALRTQKRQQQLFDAGASQTLNSRHLTGHAVDLVAVVGGKASWDWSLYFALADAVIAASQKLSIPLVWGGCWDKETSSMNLSAQEESQLYVNRARAKLPSHNKGKPIFIDGPHFQLPWRTHP
jgi:peptidoglycan LD-endopeptidase CwlK